MPFKFEQLDVWKFSIDVETVACQHITRRRGYISDITLLDEAYTKANELAKRLQSFRKSLTKDWRGIREASASYFIDEF